MSRKWSAPAFVPAPKVTKVKEGRTEGCKGSVSGGGNFYHFVPLGHVPFLSFLLLSVLPCMHAIPVMLVFSFSFSFFDAFTPDPVTSNYELDGMLFFPSSNKCFVGISHWIFVTLVCARYGAKALLFRSSTQALTCHFRRCFENHIRVDLPRLSIITLSKYFFTTAVKLFFATFLSFFFSFLKAQDP